MGDWTFDMSSAPRGRIRLIATTHGNGTRRVAERQMIIVASACGIVTLTHWLVEERRWDLFTSARPPIAWMPYEGQVRIVGEDGKARMRVVLPTHPTMKESWFDRALAQARTAA